MNNSSKPEDVVLGRCASCAVFIVGIAIVTLLYELITEVVPLVESVMSQRFMATTL
jgi:hypothetical protein